jgi:hypothetical protein
MGDNLNAVFNPATKKLLIWIGVLLAVALVIAIVAGLVKRLFRNIGGTDSGADDGNQDGSPVLSKSQQRLADDLKEASGWSFTPCYELRCKTLLAIADLPEPQLTELATYYKETYGSTIGEVMDSFYVSGCCFQKAEQVVEAKLEALKGRVKKMGI